ncbi:unnamed protein product [Rangifer tarandus platyrhynchus]|uniref:Uncharacterized protein n=1 Tax=Rangifer tarandus platyrhynchus TaxID=3082113 RepID=A0ABN8Z2F0_RANTA|nr:unnamed protein product [Rangifer tarandus platyrhynchus]
MDSVAGKLELQRFFLLWTLNAQLVTKGHEALTHPLAESIWGSRGGERVGGCWPSSDRAPVLVCVDDRQGPRKSPLMHPHSCPSLVPRSHLDRVSVRPSLLPGPVQAALTWRAPGAALGEEAGPPTGRPAESIQDSPRSLQTQGEEDFLGRWVDMETSFQSSTVTAGFRQRMVIWAAWVCLFLELAELVFAHCAAAFKPGKPTKTSRQLLREAFLSCRVDHGDPVMLEPSPASS